MSQPHSQVKGPFAKQLSLELGPNGEIKTSQPFYETTVPGVFAVGDCATVMKSVSQGVAMVSHLLIYIVAIILIIFPGSSSGWRPGLSIGC